MNPPIRKVLVVQPFGIGDSLFVTPLLRTLKASAKVERLDMMVGSRTKEVFERNPAVDRIFVIDRDRLRKQSPFKNFFELSRLILDLRKTRYDLLIDCSLSREYGFYAKFFAGIPERIGFNYKQRGVFLTRKVELPGGFDREPVAEYYTALLKQIGINVTDRRSDFFLKREDLDRAKSVLESAGIGTGGNYAVAVPGGGDSWGRDAHFKQWSPFGFAQVMNGISRRFPLEALVILGTAREFETGSKVAAVYGGKSVNFCGKLSLIESAAVLKGALFLLANDSGLVHIARAMEIPCIAFYGPVNEKVYGAYPRGPAYLSIARDDLDCRPCYQSFRYDSSCLHRACLTELSPVRVIDEILKSGFFEILKERKAPSVD